MNVTFSGIFTTNVSLPYVCMYMHIVYNSMCMLVSVSVCVHVLSVHGVYVCVRVCVCVYVCLVFVHGV